MARVQERQVQGVRGVRRLVVAGAVLLAGGALAGCSDDGGDAEGATDDEPTAEETEATAGGASGADQVTVEIIDIGTAYEPSSVSVATGGEVLFSNVDDIPHTVTADDGSFDSGNMDAGAEFTFTAEEPGTYPYICDIHPTMKGEIVVE